MKKYLLILLIPIFSFCGIVDTASFSADFRQTVTNEFNKKITYTGNFKAKKPYFAVWNYKEPVNKSIHINSNEIVIVEPELEQATYTILERPLDFFEILRHAIRINEKFYQANINDMLVDIYLNNGIVYGIRYKDKLENLIEIQFSKQDLNDIKNLDIFKPKIPAEYDIIR
jgi:outer membrane lipoprotein carrier protein